MRTDSIKQWVGPILAALYLVCYSIIFTDFQDFDLVAVFVLITRLPILGIAEILSNPPALFLVFAFIYMFYRSSERNWPASILFIVSYFFSGILWTSSPYAGYIDFVISFYNVTAVDFMTLLLFGGYEVYMEFLISSMIQFVLAIILLGYILLVSERKIDTFMTAFSLFIITILWSFLPELPLLFHPYVGSVVPLPIGPLLALFILPFINRPVLGLD